MGAPRILWAPQAGPQKALIDCPYPLVGFGGARGGGKSDGVLGKYGLKAQRHGKYFNAVMFRRELPQADDLIDRAKEIYLGSGATWHEQKKQFIFSGGGRLRFRPLESVADAEKYQGQNLTDAAIEEAGNYPDPLPIDRLFGALRSKRGVPTQMVLTFNPGGRGHSWLKERFIAPAPFGFEPLEWALSNGDVFSYIFIPSRVTDNQILLANDPGYVTRLHLVGSPELVRAWLEGDWDINIGAYFPELGQRHRVAPFTIPRHWRRMVGFDWGYNSPFFAVWGGISSGKDDAGNEIPIPKGAIVIYNEYSGTKISNAEIARGILARNDGEIDQLVADPAIFANQGGPSIASQFQSAGVYFRAADNERISGWSQIRMRLISSPPMLYITTACPLLWESLSALPADERRPEDADTTANDHGPDSLRYLCKVRPLESVLVSDEEAVKMGSVRIKKYVDERRKQQKRAHI
jgi:hypothetical protein